MIKKEDLDYLDSNEEFNEINKAVLRYIKSQVFSKEDAEDLTQITVVRVIQKLKDEVIKWVDEGYFIRVSQYVLLEFFRKITAERDRFVSNTKMGEESEYEVPIDAKAQIISYDEAEDRAIINDCLLECFEKQSLDNQELLWRYSFNDEEHTLDLEEPSSYSNFFRTLLDSVRDIRDKFIDVQDNYEPITDNVRLKICRIRKKLNECLENCVTEKKKQR